MKISIMILIAAVAQSAIGYEPSGWRLHVPADGLKADVAAGRVSLTFVGRGFACGGDGYVYADLPLLSRGTLDFDVIYNPPQSGKTLGAFLSFYGVTVFWHGGCGDWRAYFPDPNARREMAFNIEPVSHRRISKFKAGEWHHVRIAFDAKADRVEYYLDDMSDPALAVGDRSVWGSAEFMGGEIRIGGMGGSRGGTCTFKNIVLTKRKTGNAATLRTDTLLFDGMGGDLYGVHDILADEKPRVYTLDPTRSMYLPMNSFKYSRLPGHDTMLRAKRIVLADAPAGPGGVLPDFVLADISDAVHDGAELIVLGGQFSLGKGEYAGTPLDRIMPDEVVGLKPFDAMPDGPRTFERTIGHGKVKVFCGFKFSCDVKETRERFLPFAKSIFSRIE